MKRQLYKLLSIASIATCGLASAMSFSPDCNNNCGICDPCCGSPCGSFDVWGDALFFKPSSCNFDFVVSDKVTNLSPYYTTTDYAPEGCEHGVCPKYHWGFRVGATYRFPCSETDASIYYSRLNAQDHRHTDLIGNEVLWPSSVISGFTPALLSGDAFAFANVRHQWNAVDGEIGYTLTRSCRFSVRGHIGLHWVDLKVCNHVGYNGSWTPVPAEAAIADPQRYSGEYFSDVKTWGIGPRFGTDFNYDLGCGLGLVARASWGILAGETKHRIEATNFDPFSAQPQPIGSVTLPSDFGICNKNRCVVFPEFDTALGINYNVNFCRCFDCLFEIGWEFRTYLQSIAHSYYVDSSDITNGVSSNANAVTVCDPFNLQGLYLRGMIKF